MRSILGHAQLSLMQINWWLKPEIIGGGMTTAVGMSREILSGVTWLPINIQSTHKARQCSCVLCRGAAPSRLNRWTRKGSKEIQGTMDFNERSNEGGDDMIAYLGESVPVDICSRGSMATRLTALTLWRGHAF